MSDSNRNKNVNRWAELAEQLGVPETPHAAPEARQETPAPQTEPERPSKIHREEPDDSFAWTPAPKGREEAVPREDDVDEDAETAFQPEAVHVESFAENVVIQSESTPDSTMGEDAEEASEDSEAASPRTAGRRRRRRRS